MWVDNNATRVVAMRIERKAFRNQKQRSHWKIPVVDYFDGVFLSTLNPPIFSMSLPSLPQHPLLCPPIIMKSFEGHANRANPQVSVLFLWLSSPEPQPPYTVFILTHHLLKSSFLSPKWNDQICFLLYNLMGYWQSYLRTL